MANVTINGGIEKTETKKPTTIPDNVPINIAAKKATGVGIPKSTTNIALVAPHKATIEPTPKSIFPVKTHNSIPIDKITIYPFCIIKLFILVGEAFFPPVNI